MTLLFGFFVLLYSFSRVDEKKFEIIRKDVARYFGGQIKINPTVKKLEDEIQDVISASGIDKKTQLVARDSELELRFNGSLHFIPGTAKLDENSNFLLSKLIDTIKKGVKADSISVEGHTDDSPISSEVFPSNWELSSARASTVVREFEKFGFDSTKLTAKGFGSSRPIAPNRDSKGEVIAENQESNRRVIITVAFNREIDDAIRAMKSGQFVSADAPENFGKTPLIHQGEGELTWSEKMGREIASAQEKLKLAEDRLRESDERARAARNLAEMQGRLKQVETRIMTSQKETQKFLGIAEANKAARFPASVRKKGKKAKSQAPASPQALSVPAQSVAPTAPGAAPGAPGLLRQCRLNGRGQARSVVVPPGNGHRAHSTVVNHQGVVGACLNRGEDLGHPQVVYSATAARGQD
jgi:chemotaxis protein MotB